MKKKKLEFLSRPELMNGTQHLQCYQVCHHSPSKKFCNFSANQ